jgi:hypothetical protein
MTPVILPLVKSVYLCDDALRDPNTGKIHLLGAFTGIRLPEGLAFPYRQPRFCVFARFVDGYGPIPFRVKIVSARSGDAIFETQDHTIRFTDRLATAWASFRIVDCLFDEPGVYLAELYCGGLFVDDRSLTLRGKEGEAP